MVGASTAVAAVGGAAGLRAWIRAKLGDRIGILAMRAVTVTLVLAAILVASITISGPGPTG